MPTKIHSPFIGGNKEKYREIKLSSSQEARVSEFVNGLQDLLKRLNFTIVTSEDRRPELFLKDWGTDEIVVEMDEVYMGNFYVCYDKVLIEEIKEG